MYFWNKKIECYIETTPDFINGEVNLRKLVIYGKFLVFGNVIMINETVNMMGKEAERSVCLPGEAVFLSRVNGLYFIAGFFINDEGSHAYISLVSRDEIKRMFEKAVEYNKTGVPLTDILSKIQIKKPSL